jgi:cytosine/adenosine deaminase-related metal-dependent hydrolase
LGRPELQRIESGAAADLAIFDISTLACAGAFDPLAALLFRGFDQRAWKVIVNGIIVVEE